MIRVCIDSNFLIALYDERDQHHIKALNYFENYYIGIGSQMIVPWPIMYESLSTRMVRDRKKILAFQNDWKKMLTLSKLQLLDDRPYRDDALDDYLNEVQRHPRQYRSLSLTDRVIRKILSDKSIKIDYFITFNQGDFVDVCKRYNRRLAEL